MMALHVGSLVACSLLNGFIAPVLRAQSVTKPATEMPKLIDDDLFRPMEEIDEKIAFQSLHEVFFKTFAEVHPGGESRQAGSLDPLRPEFVQRLKKMGLKLCESDDAARPMLTLSLNLIRVPDSQYLGYALELILSENVTLNRPSVGQAFARTHAFRSFGRFSKVAFEEELKAESKRLLDRLERALKVAKSKP